jgi:glyoxylase-like metal-dependent hydrolase (beta-lactamase superfamily II)
MEGHVLVTSFAAPAFATNCWIIASARGGECIVVDPGMPDVTGQISHICQENDLKPVAVLITHGHLDHTFSIVPTCGEYGIPAYIHSEDRALLVHPEKALSAQFASSLVGVNFKEPTEVREMKNNDLLEMVGLRIKVIHAPGHTRGSVLYEVADENGESSLLSGDVLFAGSIGRTDQPTGSARDMENTLKKKIWPLPDALRVLPGHGPETTIGHEKRVNPFLKGLKDSRVK